eukprot:CAMPEP_0184280164 /NCGR_PEP_ID=MMETSP0977-20130417/57878_1 /TAXON_ID=483370 /ORGANISM="non described non described, Strain CCMP2097" /LENGTH=136 /DNA_ID=CAMNT_0026586125 /DNA_START=169 /DNA_END=577 /DNA_ORIENTATION=-
MRGAVPHKLYPWKDARLKDPADAVPMLFSLNALLHSARALTATIIDSKARSISMIGRALEVEFYVAPAAVQDARPPEALARPSSPRPRRARRRRATTTSPTKTFAPRPHPPPSAARSCRTATSSSPTSVRFGTEPP